MGSRHGKVRSSIDEEEEAFTTSTPGHLVLGDLAPAARPGHDDFQPLGRAVKVMLKGNERLTCFHVPALMNQGVDPAVGTGPPRPSFTEGRTHDEDSGSAFCRCAGFLGVLISICLSLRIPCCPGYCTMSASYRPDPLLCPCRVCWTGSEPGPGGA